MTKPRKAQSAPQLRTLDVVLSASKHSAGCLKEVCDELIVRGLKFQAPNLELLVTETTREKKAELTITFLDHIRDAKYLLVVANDAGYIGNSVSLEIGFALGLGKKVLSLCRLSDPALDAVCQRTTLDGLCSLLQEGRR